MILNKTILPAGGFGGSGEKPPATTPTFRPRRATRWLDGLEERHRLSSYLTCFIEQHLAKKNAMIFTH